VAAVAAQRRGGGGSAAAAARRRGGGGSVAAAHSATTAGDGRGKGKGDRRRDGTLRRQNVRWCRNGDGRPVVFDDIDIEEEEIVRNYTRVHFLSSRCHSFCMCTSSSKVRGSDDVNSNKRGRQEMIRQPAGKAL
jgi:hypothetical protein